MLSSCQYRYFFLCISVSTSFIKKYPLTNEDLRIYGVHHGVCFDTWIDYIMFNWVSLPISSNICNFVFMLEHLKSFLPSWNTSSLLWPAVIVLGSGMLGLVSPNCILVLIDQTVLMPSSLWVSMTLWQSLFYLQFLWDLLTLDFYIWTGACNPCPSVLWLVSLNTMASSVHVNTNDTLYPFMVK